MKSHALNSGQDRSAGKEASSAVVDILGLQVQSHTYESLNEAIGQRIHCGGHDIVPNVNVFFANLSWRRPWLRDLFNSSPINFCDGAGIQLAARILGDRIAVRITYGDWFASLAEFCRRRKFRLYFLGGRPGVAAEASRRVTSSYPGLVIAGTHHGYFDKSRQSAENTEVVADINRCRPEILLVALGMPLQEEWLAQNWHQLDAGVALTGGAILDYLSGSMRRPPAWLCGCGMEWLGRLLIEPRRLWKRYLLGNPLFLMRILRQRLQRGRLSCKGPT